MEPTNIRQAIEGADLEELLLKLYVYTRNRLKRMFWHGQRGGPIPGGWEVEDFIQNAIEKALKQVRVWNPEKSDLYKFLTDIISSDVNHLAEKSENKLVCRALPDLREVDGSTVRFNEPEAKRSEWPDSILFEEEERIERETILKMVGDSDIDQAIVAMIIDTDDSIGAAEIASKLNVSVDDVYRSKRRLRKKLRELKGRNT